MQYQTFRGSDVKEALSRVRAELGADALIGSTRRVSNGRDGAFSHAYVEVTAAPAAPLGGPLEQPGRRPPHGVRRRPVDARGAAAPAGRDAEAPGRAGELAREVQELQRLVDELSAGRSPREKAQAMLHAVGVEGAIARDLSAGSLRAARAGRGALRAWLRNRVADRLRVAPRLIERPYRQVVACVGPTGVGKTTTLAKLAARAALDQGRRVHVITLDTYRVGAVEQWERYAELIGIPCDVARDADEFERLLRGTPADLVLVDTAGRSPSDDGPTRRLAACLERVGETRTEVLLVVPAFLRAADVERLTQSYEDPHPTAIVVTKLDETTEAGGILHAALPRATPVAYLCDGPRVPEDLRDAAVDAVVEAVLPRED